MTSMTLDREPIQAAITVLAEAVEEQADADDLLARVCDCVAAQRGLAGVTITCLRPDGTVAASGAYPASLRAPTRQRMERLEGPCADACRSGEPVLVDDLPGQGAIRWPSWARQATAAGAVRARSEPIKLDGRVIGAAATLGGPGHELGLAQDTVAWAVVQVAAAYVVAVSARGDAQALSGQLQSALDSRVRIEQAKGALAAHLGVGVDEAFEWLRQASRNHNRRLHEVAAEVVEQLVPARGLPGAKAGVKTQASGLRIASTPLGLRLGGAADDSAAPALQAALACLGHAGTTVDLRGLDFLDAQCARLLVNAAERLPENTVLTLLAPNREVSRVLAHLGADRNPRIRLVVAA